MKECIQDTLPMKSSSCQVLKPGLLATHVLAEFLSCMQGTICIQNALRSTFDLVLHEQPGELACHISSTCLVRTYTCVHDFATQAHDFLLHVQLGFDLEEFPRTVMRVAIQGTVAFLSKPLSCMHPLSSTGTCTHVMVIMHALAIKPRHCKVATMLHTSCSCIPSEPDFPLG